MGLLRAGHDKHSRPPDGPASVSRRQITTLLPRGSFADEGASSGNDVQEVRLGSRPLASVAPQHSRSGSDPVVANRKGLLIDSKAPASYPQLILSDLALERCLAMASMLGKPGSPVNS
jgi:hypothetical protein